MVRIPVVSGREAVAAFERAGWRRKPRRSGNHIVLTKKGHLASLSVPDHDCLSKGTLRSLIRNAGMTVDQFVALLK